MLNIITTIMAILLMALIMGKAVVGALTHIAAWVMTRLADIGYFNTQSSEDYMKFYTECGGRPDIEH